MRYKGEFLELKDSIFISEHLISTSAKQPVLATATEHFIKSLVSSNNFKSIVTWNFYANTTIITTSKSTLQTTHAIMFAKFSLLALAASTVAFALPSSSVFRRESPTTWQVSNYQLTNPTGNGYTYSFQISGEAPDGGFNTLCTGSTVQAGLLPCVQNTAVTAVVHSTGTVNGVQGFELSAAFAGATGEVQVPAGETSFVIVFEEAA